MASAHKPIDILISWVGNTDLRASRGEDEGLGPVAQAVLHRSFEPVVLLSNYPGAEVEPYIEWLQAKTPSTLECHLIELTSPTYFGEIYEAVSARIHATREKHGSDARLTYHLSPGTPAMAAVWIILAKTRYAAELIESSREGGVRHATVPFDISAEFIPDILNRPDSDVSRLTEARAEVAPAFDEIIHRGASMRRVIAKAQKVAPRSVPVLIEGESGTGKELLARAIHEASLRQGQPFIAVNCGAVSVELAESEFFGHKKGAFTGAHESRKGHFREANGGTLFLDELGELPLNLQVKLLRVLQEGHLVPVGESKPVAVDVRIIAATNRNLTTEVTEGRFREDLFFRLAVAVIRLPPLRERAGDLSLLIDHLWDKVNRESAAEPAWMNKNLSPGGRNLLMKHDWRGNIRELLNTLTRAVVWSGGSVVTPEDIRDALLESPAKAAARDAILNRDISDGFDLNDLLSIVARHYISRALEETQGNKSKAAEMLSLGSYQTLNNWVKKYGID